VAGQSNAPIGEVFIIISGMLGAIIVLVVLVGGAKRLVGRARTRRQDLDHSAVHPSMSDPTTGVAHAVAPAPTETQFLEQRTIIAVSDIDGFSFSPDGQRLAICSWPSYGGVIQLFDTEDGTLIWRYRALLTPLEDVAFSPTGRLLATGSTLGQARILDAASGRRLREIAQHNGVVSGLAFSPDGRRLATSSSDGSIQISDVTAGGLELQIKLERAPGSVIVFGPDGSLLATGGDDGIARIWDARTGQQELQLHHGKVVTGVAFSPDGSLLATSGDDGFARIWDVRTGRQRLQLHHGKVVARVGFSPDSRLVATSGYDKTLRIWPSPKFDTN
jgi:WD40 repeat protein